MEQNKKQSKLNNRMKFIRSLKSSLIGEAAPSTLKLSKSFTRMPAKITTITINMEIPTHPAKPFIKLNVNCSLKDSVGDNTSKSKNKIPAKIFRGDQDHF